MQLFRWAAVGLIAITLTGCSWVPEFTLWQPSYDFPAGRLKVEELRRALLCGTPTEEPVVRLFDSATALTAWDANNSLQLERLELPEQRSFILLEQGLRRTGGYSVEIAKSARVDAQGVLRFKAEWLEPKPDRMVTQMMTSLCVLVAVDAMPYTRVEVLDAKDEVRAAASIIRE